MNRIYRLVFNPALGQVQVASELAGGAHGGGASCARSPRVLRRRVLAALLALCCAGSAVAATLPTGGAFAQGAGTIDTSSSSQLTVNQTSQRGLINWSSFSIGADGTVSFQQPGTGAVTLNVVNGATASLIDGALNANGQVFLINTNGIVFGGTASVNVGGLVASSLPLASGDASSDLWQLGDGSAATTTVRNAGGTLNAAGGSISLIGAGVSNSGVLGASSINLVAGGTSEVTYDNGTSLFTARVIGPAGATALGTPLTNTGTLLATNVFLDAWGSNPAISMNIGGTLQATGIDPATGSLVIHATNGAVVSDASINTGDLTVLSYTNGSVNAVGALTIGGTTNVNSNGDISLGNTANTFGGDVTLEGRAVSMNASGALDLFSVLANSLSANADGPLMIGTAITTGDMALSGGGSITQTSAIHAGGNASFTSNGNITLLNAGNEFVGTVALNGGLLDIAAAGTLRLGNVDATRLAATADSLGLTQDITTSGGQTYHGDVLLAGGLTLENSGTSRIDFDGTVNGAYNLAINNGGVTSFGGTVGGTSAPSSLITTGGTVELGGDITTLGYLGIGSALKLTGTRSLTSNLGDINLGGAVNASSTGLQSLTVHAGGAATLGSVGATAALGSLTVSGTSGIRLGGNVTTTGAQSYQSAAQLTGDAVLASTGGGAIGFAGAVNGNYGLTVNTAGTTSFDTAIGSSTPLASLATDAAGASELRGNVTANGNVRFGDPLRLLGSATISSNAGSVNFAQVDGAYDLAANSSTGTVFGGDATLRNLAVGSINGPGTVSLGGDITATNRVDFLPSVVLSGDATINASGLRFYQGIDGNHALILRSAGVVEVDGAIGAATPLAGLDIEAATLAAHGIATRGDLDLAVTGTLFQTDAYQVGGDATFSAGGSVILTNAGNLFEGTVAVDAGTVDITASTNLALDQVNASTLTATTLTGTLGLDHANIGNGGVQLNGAAIQLGAVSVSGNLSVLGGRISQHDVLDIGGNASFVVGANDIDLGLANRFGGAVKLTGGTVQIGADGALALDTVQASNLSASATTLSFTQPVATSGYQHYDGAITLAQDTTLTAGGTVDIIGSIDGNAALTINALGTTTLDGEVGQTTALSSLGINGAARIGGDVTTSGNQSYGGTLTLLGDTGLTSTGGGIALGTVDGAHALALQAQGNVALGMLGAATPLASLQVVAGGVAFNGASITTVGAQHYAAPVVLGHDQTLTSRNGGNIVFDGSIEGAFALTANTAGTTVFAGPVGSNVWLTALTTDAAGTTQLGGNLAAAYDINFNDAVSLANFTSVQSVFGNVDFGKTVTGAQGLIVQAAIGTTFGGAIDIASLLVQGNGTTTLHGDVNVATNAVFGRPVLLAGDVAMTGQAFDFGAGIDGAHALDVQASQRITVAGDIGAATPLASLSITAPTLTARGIATTGNLALDTVANLTQAGAYQVGGDASFASGGNLVLLDAGNRFDGSVALDGTDVSINASSALDLQQVRAGSLHATAAGGLGLGHADVTGGAVLEGAAVTFADARIGGDLGATSSGTISQGGALQVAGNSTLAAAGDIALTDGGNRFDGTLDLSGRAIAVTAAGDLAIANLRNAANAAVALQAGGALRLGGSAIDTGSADLSLSAQAGSLLTTAALSGAQVRLSGRDGIALAGDVTANDLRLQSGNAAISQGTGALNVSGTTAVDSGTGAITLAAAGNHFGGAVSLRGGAVAIHGADALQLASVSASGLDASAGNGLTVGAASVAGNAGLDAGAGALALNDVSVGGDLHAKGANIDQTGIFDVAGAATLASSGSLNLRNLGAGSLDASAGNGLSMLGASVRGDAALHAGAGTLMFANASIGGDLLADGAAITQGGTLAVVGAAALASTGAMLLEAVSAGSLSARAGTGLTLNGGHVGHAATLDSGAGTLAFNGVRIGGDLHASGASINQAGTLDVAGAATFASAGSIGVGQARVGSLAIDAGNVANITDTVIDGDATLTAAAALSLANLRVAGDLRGNGSQVVQTGTLDVTGAAYFNSAGSLWLGNLHAGSLQANAGNALSVDGATVVSDAVFGAHDALRFNDVAIAGNLQANGASIAQTGALAVAGAATFASGGAIALGGLTAGSLDVTAGNGLALAGARVDGNASLDAGTGTLAFDDVTIGNHLQAAGGNIVQAGTLAVGGAANFDSAGSIALGAVTASTLQAHAGNGLDLAAATVANDAVLDAGSGALVFGDVQVGNDLQASGASIGQRNRLRVDGTSQFASSGDIRLDQAGNSFAGGVTLRGGQVAIAASGDLALAQVDAAALQAGSTGTLRVADARIASHAALAGNGVLLADTRVAGDLDVASGQGIGQDGAVNVAGASRLNAAGAIVLDNAGNDFQGAVSVDGQGVRITDGNDLQIAALGNIGVGAAAAGRAQALDAGNGDVSLVAGGNLTLPAQAIDLGDAALSLQANGGRLSVQSALAAGDIQLGARDGIALAADVSAVRALDLRTAGSISQGGGRLSAASLTGQAGGAATLSGDNRIATLGDFSAASLLLGNAASLTVAGNVQAGSSARLEVRGGDLRIDGHLAADAVRLQSTGAIDEGAGGSIATAALSGRSGGATRLGTADGFVANQVARLGDFAAAGGFSLTNAGTLSLGALNGSDFSVDTGDAAFFLKVDGGDLLQQGTTPVYAGDGHWWSSGRIGTAADPIYVITNNPVQVVDFVGLPPAYFFAVHPDGTPVTIGGAVNLPTTAIAERAQSGSLHRVAYVDVGALNAEYRAFGIVQPGIRLPADQAPACDSGDPDAGCTP